MLNPHNRTVMISGANRGIGFAVAQHLSASGYHVSLGARDPSSIDTSVLSGKFITQQYDAVDSQSATEWARKTHDHFGSVDAVVLNAGVIKPFGVENGDDADLDLMWDVNFKGPLKLVRATMPSLRASGSGRIVNVVSLSGKRLLSESNLGYGASKFAALALTHAIRQTGWDDGVRATAICPGLVDTDMVSAVNTPAGEYKISPEAIAATTAYALSLPNDASVAEILVNSRLEPSF